MQHFHWHFSVVSFDKTDVLKYAPHAPHSPKTAERNRFTACRRGLTLSINFSDEACSEKGPSVTDFTTAGVLLSPTVCTHVTLPHRLSSSLTAAAAAAAAPRSRGPNGRSVLWLDGGQVGGARGRLRGTHTHTHTQTKPSRSSVCYHLPGSWI